MIVIPPVRVDSDACLRASSDSAIEAGMRGPSSTPQSIRFSDPGPAFTGYAPGSDPAEALKAVTTLTPSVLGHEHFADMLYTFIEKASSDSSSIDLKVHFILAQVEPWKILLESVLNQRKVEDFSRLIKSFLSKCPPPVAEFYRERIRVVGNIDKRLASSLGPIIKVADDLSKFDSKAQESVREYQSLDSSAFQRESLEGKKLIFRSLFYRNLASKARLFFEELRDEEKKAALLCDVLKYSKEGTPQASLEFIRTLIRDSMTHRSKSFSELYSASENFRDRLATLTQTSKEAFQIGAELLAYSGLSESERRDKILESAVCNYSRNPVSGGIFLVDPELYRKHLAKAKKDALGKKLQELKRMVDQIRIAVRQNRGDATTIDRGLQASLRNLRTLDFKVLPEGSGRYDPDRLLSLPADSCRSLICEVEEGVQNDLKNLIRARLIKRPEQYTSPVKDSRVLSDLESLARMDLESKSPHVFDFSVHSLYDFNKERPRLRLESGQAGQLANVLRSLFRHFSRTMAAEGIGSNNFLRVLDAYCSNLRSPQETEAHSPRVQVLARALTERNQSGEVLEYQSFDFSETFAKAFKESLFQVVAGNQAPQEAKARQSKKLPPFSSDVLAWKLLLDRELALYASTGCETNLEELLSGIRDFLGGQPSKEKADTAQVLSALIDRRALFLLAVENLPQSLENFANELGKGLGRNDPRATSRSYSSERRQSSLPLQVREIRDTRQANELTPEDLTLLGLQILDYRSGAHGHNGLSCELLADILELDPRQSSSDLLAKVVELIEEYPGEFKRSTNASELGQRNRLLDNLEKFALNDSKNLDLVASAFLSLSSSKKNFLAERSEFLKEFFKSRYTQFLSTKDFDLIQIFTPAKILDSLLSIAMEDQETLTSLEALLVALQPNKHASNFQETCFRRLNPLPVSPDRTRLLNALGPRFPGEKTLQDFRTSVEETFKDFDANTGQEEIEALGQVYKESCLPSEKPQKVLEPVKLLWSKLKPNFEKIKGVNTFAKVTWAEYFKSLNKDPSEDVSKAKQNLISFAENLHQIHKNVVRAFSPRNQWSSVLRGTSLLGRISKLDTTIKDLTDKFKFALSSLSKSVKSIVSLEEPYASDTRQKRNSFAKWKDSNDFSKQLEFLPKVLSQVFPKSREEII
jgi:hypothetical protein